MYTVLKLLWCWLRIPPSKLGVEGSYAEPLPENTELNKDMKP